MEIIGNQPSGTDEEILSKARANSMTYLQCMQAVKPDYRDRQKYQLVYTKFLHRKNKELDFNTWMNEQDEK